MEVEMKKLTALLIFGALFLSILTVDARFRFGRRRRHHRGWETEFNSRSPEKAKAHRVSAADYEKKAEAAEKAGNKELAALYRDCAKYRKIIADGVEGKAEKSKVADAWKKYEETLKKIAKLTGKTPKETK